MAWSGKQKVCVSTPLPPPSRHTHRPLTLFPWSLRSPISASSPLPPLLSLEIGCICLSKGTSQRFSTPHRPNSWKYQIQALCILIPKVISKKKTTMKPRGQMRCPPCPASCGQRRMAMCPRAAPLALREQVSAGPPGWSVGGVAAQVHHEAP